MEIPALWPVYAGLVGGQRGALKPKPKPTPKPKSPPPAPPKLATAAPTTAFLTPPPAIAPPAAKPPGCLDGVVVVTDYGPGTRFLEKQALRADAERLGATVTTILPSKPAASKTVVVALHPPAAPTPLMRRSVVAGVPIVGPAYLAACAAQQQRIATEPFVLPVAAPHITADQPPEAAVIPTAPARKLCSVRDVEPLDAADPTAQAYEAHPASYVVLRYIYLLHCDGQQACCIELDECVGSAPARFRVLYQVSARRSKGMMDATVHEVRLVTVAVDAEAIYAELVDTHLTAQGQWTRVLLPPACGLGSPGLHRLEAARRGVDVPPAVRDLLTDIFEAADTRLSQELNSTGLSSITPEQLDQAESLLLTAERATLVPRCGGAGPSNWLEQLTDEFYAALPVQLHPPEPLSDLAVLRRKQTLCRLLRDLLAVREGAGCALFDATAAPGGDDGDLRYRALGCELTPLDPASDEYRAVVDAVGLAAPSSRPLAVNAIFVARRPTEAHAFLEGIAQQRLLVHSTRAEHVVGILTRGLQLPQFAQVERTDLGNLGAGIYFADAASVSAAYSRPSASGYRYMVACTVALGKVLETQEHQPRLRTCPEGYDSVHGVPGRGSEFADDEYVIFDARQQQLEYLIQFHYANEAAPSAPPAGTPAIPPLWLSTAAQHALPSSPSPSPPGGKATVVDLSDVLNVADPLSKVPSGLRCGVTAVPLVGVHVSARLVDLAAEVVVFQEYWNQNEWPLEAKYVFPLPPLAAVCGFEGSALCGTRSDT